MIRSVSKIIAAAILLLLSGCAASGTMANNEPLEPKIDTIEHIIEHNITLYNNTGAVINEVYLVQGDMPRLLAGSIEPGVSASAYLSTTDRSPPEQEGFSNWESPYFVLIVAGNEIPVTVARLWRDDSLDIYEELRTDSDEIAFFFTEGVYYFSPQSDYLDKEGTRTESAVQVQYRYLSQVRRFLRQREGQLLFAAGLEEEDFLTYFPGYTGELPRFGRTAVISSETIYLEDVYVEIDDDYKTVTEIRRSDELRMFTPEDVIVVSVDHVRFANIYFRYKDAQGNVHRQYVNDQFRDNNNGGIVMNMLTLDDEYYECILVE